MINNIKKVMVNYKNQRVGYLAEIDENKIAFEYDDKWIEQGFSISPLSLPLEKKVFVCDGGHFNGLYGVFQDSLPDGFGELVLRRNLARFGFNFDKLSPLTKLSLVRDNGLGALTYEPSQTDNAYERYLNLDKLAKDSQKIYDDNFEEVDLDEVYKLGGSSGGARPKAHIKENGEYWIVKFGCRIDPPNIAKIELDTNLLAKRCGLNVNVFKLFDSNEGVGYFGAKRFDRINDERIHVLSLSSLLETTHRIPNLDYLHFFQVVNRICDKEELYEAFRRMCFNVYAGNKDDHGKNFSFLYDEKNRTYTLSPAYDLTPTKFKAEHEMTVNGNGKPLDEDMIIVAQKFKLDILKCKDIMQNMKKIIKN